MYSLLRRRTMMMKPSVVPTERLIYQLYDYTCDGTVNTFIDTGIKLFGIEYEAFRIEMEYDGLDITTHGQETLLECKGFASSSNNPGFSVRVVDSNSSFAGGKQGLNTNFNPVLKPNTGPITENTSSAILSIVYNKKTQNGTVVVNSNTHEGSGNVSIAEPLTIGGRYSSHLSNPDRFVQVHISSLKIYATPSGIDPSYIYTPLTFKCLTGGNLSIKNANTSYDRNFEYSLNDGAWTAVDLPKNTASKFIATLSPNDTISFRRYNENFADAQFISDSNLTFDVYGNLLSLQYGSAFNGQTELRNINKKAFGAIFSGTNVVDASKLMLTASTLSNNCYQQMFKSCTSLVSAPILPASTLSDYCYAEMFSECTSLIVAPIIYAQSLSSYSCSSMFANCTNLTNVPRLNFISLNTGCCIEMFKSCTSLVNAPELPATVLKNNCYQNLFWGCTSIRYIKCLATDISAPNCTYNWLAYIEGAVGTFVKASGVTWPSGASGIPNGWTVIEE